MIKCFVFYPRYKYSKDDEEIYKEFMEIANELIPHVMKAEAASGKSVEESVLSDPYCFGRLIRFYDGICCWEEGSPTPVLHIGWAKPMVASFSKFDAVVRNQLKFSGSLNSEEDEELDEGKSTSPSLSNINGHENILVDTDDNSSLQNESFHSASSDEGICLLTPTSSEVYKEDKLKHLGSSVPKSSKSKSKGILNDENGEVAINNNYFDKYPSTKSTSTHCDTTTLSMSLKSSLSPSYDIPCVKNNKNSTIDMNKSSKDILPSDEKHICDNPNQNVQNSSLISTHQKRKYLDVNDTSCSQDYYNKKCVQRKCQNSLEISISNNEYGLNRCKRNSCDKNYSEQGGSKYNPEHNLLVVANSHKNLYERNDDMVSLLSSVCGTKLISIEYLLGNSDEPFLQNDPNQENFSVSKLLSKDTQSAVIKPKFTVLISDGNNSKSSSPGILTKMELQSAKMIGLKELLCSEKMNTSAIQLQLTAQSQTESKAPIRFGNNLNGLSDDSFSNRPKRSRRE